MIFLSLSDNFFNNTKIRRKIGDITFSTKYFIRFVGFVNLGSEKYLKDLIKRLKFDPFYQNNYHRFEFVIEKGDEIYNNNGFTLFIVQTDKCIKTSYHIMDSSDGWVKMGFCDSEFPSFEPPFSYIISKTIYDFLHVSLFYPMKAIPRMSFEKLNDTLVILSSNTYNISDSLANFNMNIGNVVMYQHLVERESLSIICQTCNSLECALKLLKMLNEYKEHKKDSLPVFILPDDCPYQYSSSDIVICPNENELSLVSSLRKEIFGFDSPPLYNSFFPMISKRNIVYQSINRMVSNIKTIYDEISEVILHDKNEIDVSISQNIKALILEFVFEKNSFVSSCLNNNNDIDNIDFRSMKNISESIESLWNNNKPLITRIRNCSQKQRFFFSSIPFIMFVLSLVMSSFLFFYVYRYMGFRDPLSIFIDSAEI